jgi:LuxR family quorum sensing-dependent transcriptional regulator
MSIEANTFDFIERCGGYRTPRELLDDLLSCVRQFGFEHLILAGVPVGKQALGPLIELNGWPEGWLQRYVERGYADVDGVCIHAARSAHPFFWRDVPSSYGGTAASRRVAGEASEFGINSGYVVPMASRRHWQAALSLASSAARCDISAREQSSVNLMSVFAVGAVEALLVADRDEEHLSAREREVLSWAAAGKSAWETSCILSISSRTVDKHLAAIRGKYGVRTTLQAVVEGIRRREIFP